MKKFLFAFFLSFINIFLWIRPIEASIITVNSEGEVVWNVLSIQDELDSNEDLEDFSVRKVADVNTAGNDVINVENNDGKVKLSVGTGDNARQIDVENIEDTLVEIEQRPTVQQLTIGKKDDKFTITQRGTVVDTNLPIQINPESARLSLRTSSGNSYLYILPREAVLSVYRSKVATQLREDKNIELVESGEKLVYKIPGEKILTILSLYNYSFDVDSYISAQTGELVEVDAPTWYKIFGFLITQQL